MQGVELAGCLVWKPGSAPASGVPCQRTLRWFENSGRDLGTEKWKPQIQSLERSNKNIPLLQLFLGTERALGRLFYFIVAIAVWYCLVTHRNGRSGTVVRGAGEGAAGAGRLCPLFPIPVLKNCYLLFLSPIFSVTSSCEANLPSLSKAAALYSFWIDICT